MSAWSLIVATALLLLLPMLLRPGRRPSRRAYWVGDIDAGLGAPWIPAYDILAFAAELFNVPAPTIQIGHLKKDAVWSVEAGYAAEASVAATSD